MKAMILAAGRGERLRPLTDSLPKSLIEVQGKPLIVHHLEALSRAGFSEVVINLSWLGDQIRALLGNGDAFGLTIEYSEEQPEALETAGGIVQALPLLGERFVVVNADIFTDYDFANLKQDSVAHLVLVENPRHHADGDFTLTESTIGTEGSPRYTFSGISQYHRSFFARLSPGKQALAPLLFAAAAKQQVTGELFLGTWGDIGSAERLANLNHELGQLPE